MTGSVGATQTVDDGIDMVWKVQDWLLGGRGARMKLPKVRLIREAPLQNKLAPKSYDFQNEMRNEK